MHMHKYIITHFSYTDTCMTTQTDNNNSESSYFNGKLKPGMPMNTLSTDGVCAMTKLLQQEIVTNQTHRKVSHTYMSHVHTYIKPCHLSTR